MEAPRGTIIIKRRDLSKFLGEDILFMDDFWGHIISAISGIITGVIGTICYNKLHLEYKKKKREIKLRNIQAVNIFETYGSRRIVPVVSFDDAQAIKVAPLFQNGIYLMRAEIMLNHKTTERMDQNFVMALLTYLPTRDWSYCAECGYSLKFKIRGSINGIQLEVKNKDKRKLIDEYIQVSDAFKEKEFPLAGDIGIWKDIEEICFTVFCAKEYIQKEYGYFEVMDCVLEK